MNDKASSHEYELTEQDKELIALYGPRIEQCKWCFENHEMIRVAKIEDKDQPP